MSQLAQPESYSGVQLKDNSTSSYGDCKASDNPPEILSMCWTDSYEKETEINTGGQTSRMTVNPLNPMLVATGGKQNNLKLWDLSKPKEPVFKAKNMPNDSLGLQVPVWITNIAILPCNHQQPEIITVSKYHKIQVYDPRAQRRPVSVTELGNSPLLSLALEPEQRRVIVGDNKGTMTLFDLKSKRPVGNFKGCTGSIRSIACHPSENAIAACGLDRHLRVFDLESRQPRYKFYLKSKLNSLLFHSQSFKKSKRERGTTAENDDNDSELSDVWDELEVIEDSLPQKKKKKTKSSN
ncbi:uncharacterized protein TRIADDRAFT_57177 [Trichoplax adhaerens]|uniref:Uncharacterized protein n=1 Tax=Trichoplax adhaerens TaxID=10228 RepID=B3S0U9_TRIAD|nr:hypothetical protein TRIADDRAFT_57177 [Trichoplax adhaerens]EDV24068.1 hypothetical protein TRIADDRAFT_57177 [Trichoplax adhaerens]|eukprot:XP_002113594.1 hypothetical protein TRIADDRAFT_57177 [Trichoplax adhaerens]